MLRGTSGADGLQPIRVDRRRLGDRHEGDPGDGGRRAGRVGVRFDPVQECTRMPVQRKSTRTPSSRPGRRRVLGEPLGSRHGVAPSPRPATQQSPPPAGAFPASGGERPCAGAETSSWTGGRPAARRSDRGRWTTAARAWSCCSGSWHRTSQPPSRPLPGNPPTPTPNSTRTCREPMLHATPFRLRFRTGSIPGRPSRPAAHARPVMPPPGHCPRCRRPVAGQCMRRFRSVASSTDSWLSAAAQVVPIATGSDVSTSSAPAIGQGR